MRSRIQDDYMERYEEADPIEPGACRLQPSPAPLITGKNGVVVPVKALEEAPDGRRRLDWSGQGLVTLPKIPQSYEFARVVKINDNKIQHFPPELAQLGLMQQLRIDGNSISTIPAYIDKFTLLQMLKASDNSISLISSNIGHCQHLKAIDLQRNQISSLPPNLGLCSNLETLCISSNRLSTMPETFSRLTALKVLKVDKNLLVDLGFQVASLSKLAQLHLGCNSIKTLDSNIGKMLALEDLAIHRNLIEILPPALANLERILVKLRVEDNPLHSPPLDIVQRGKPAIFLFLKRMQYGFESWDLDLGNMKMKTVPFPLHDAMPWEKDFWCRIKQLSLRNNVITSLPQEVRLMTNLTILDISSNRLSTIPPTVAMLAAVRILDAAGNRIQALPTEMSRNVSLEELLLENNLLKSVPPGVFHLKRLHDLRLASNRLTNMPEEIHDLHRLQHFSLEFNGIMTLPNTLSGLISVKVLKLSNNRLLELPPSLMKIRPSSKPPPIHRSKKEHVRESVLGKINPAIRRRRIRNVLYGGTVRGYRSVPQIPFEQREFEKPADAGDRRGWDLVRFALFGAAGPHLRPKQPEQTAEVAVTVAGPTGEAAADDDGEEDAEEKPPPRVGFVARLRGLFAGLGRRQKPAASDDAEVEGAATVGTAPGDAAAATKEVLLERRMWRGARPTIVGAYVYQLEA